MQKHVAYLPNLHIIFYRYWSHIYIPHWTKQGWPSNILFLTLYFHTFSHIDILAHLTKASCELLSPLSICRPSVNFSHFNQLHWSHWANLNQTMVEWSLDGPLPKLCPVIPTSNQDSHQAKNRKKGGWNFNCPLLL